MRAHARAVLGLIDPTDPGRFIYYNSGIATNAFYLAINGGTNRTSGLAVQGVGLAKNESKLWSVGDEATRVLMGRFYDNLWQKQMASLDAMREDRLRWEDLRATPETLRRPTWYQYRVARRRRSVRLSTRVSGIDPPGGSSSASAQPIDASRSLHASVPSDAFSAARSRPSSSRALGR